MVKKIIKEIKAELTGDPMQDIPFLQQQGEKYKSHPEAPQILKELSNMSYELLPEENKKQLRDALFIGDKRIDQTYNEANNLVKANDLDGAIKLLEEIEKKADSAFAPESTPKNFSFRNRLDEYIYVHYNNPEEKYVRTPYDFCMYFSALGYLLIEKRQPEKAVEKLKKAIAYNPVNVDPRFELAEAYKLLARPENLLETVRETLRVCTTSAYIARCYANLGYYCIEIKDYDSAVAFYYESLIYAKNPAIQGELNHIRHLTGKPIIPPTREMVLEAFKKYDIKNGPEQEIINIAYSLGSYCMEHNAHPEESLFYMSIAFDLSHDEKIRDTIDMLNAQIAAQKAKVK